MKIVALTGGIASGKSTIAARLAELGAHIIDADQLAREAVVPGSTALKQIFETFGAHLQLEDGALNRQALADVVFNDETALARLNSIVHPAVRELYHSRIAQITAVDPEAIIVYDVPLLVEHLVDTPFEHVIVASAPEETRIERLINRRGFSRAEAEARVKNQASEAQRLAAADTVIDTSTTIPETISQTDDFWAQLFA